MNRNKTIWKFQLEITDHQVVKMPKGAKILSIKTQFGKPCLWALVEDTAEAEMRHFRIFGTGHSVDNSEVRTYIDSFLIENDTLVFHVFEIHDAVPDKGNLDMLLCLSCF